MTIKQGSNIPDIKIKNRLLALQLIISKPYISRAELARNMGLTKTTLGNIVSDLISENMISEVETRDKQIIGYGRHPIALTLSESSPVIGGMLIKRKVLTAVLGDLSGKILAREDFRYEELDSVSLVSILCKMFTKIYTNQSRRIIGIGISALGPVDIRHQMLLSPPNFYGIHDLQIGSIIHQKTGFPTCLIHDCSGGALAEQLYGAKAKNYNSFLYLHIMNGIGAGYILHNQLYEGDTGGSGEIGHTSIDINGPRCDCGNRGCVELYANVPHMCDKIVDLKASYPFLIKDSRFALNNKINSSDICAIPERWEDIIDAAQNRDYFAVSALDEFCSYLSGALRSVINLLDVRHLIVGYDSYHSTEIVENIMSRKLNNTTGYLSSRKVEIEHSSFGGDAPLLGSIAVIANKIFNGSINIFKS